MDITRYTNLIKKTGLLIIVSTKAAFQAESSIYEAGNRSVLVNI